MSKEEPRGVDGGLGAKLGKPSAAPIVDWTAVGKAIGAGIQRRVAALVASPVFWVLVLGVIFVVPIGRSIALARDLPKPPAMRLPLPEFELTDQRGDRFGLSNLRGKIWVANFIFTSCPTVCPKLTRRMAEVQNRGKNLGDHFHLVSFTVDPENDTPERLLAYSQSFKINQRRWSFLTGPLDQIESTVVGGFKIAMGKEDQGAGIFSIFHGERLVLVDENGAIRGFYEANDEDIDKLMRDIGILISVR
jgi:protein SCO1